MLNFVTKWKVILFAGEESWSVSHILLETLVFMSNTAVCSKQTKKRGQEVCLTWKSFLKHDYLKQQSPINFWAQQEKQKDKQRQVCFIQHNDQIEVIQKGNISEIVAQLNEQKELIKTLLPSK